MLFCTFWCVSARFALPLHNGLEKRRVQKCAKNVPQSTFFSCNSTDYTPPPIIACHQFKTDSCILFCGVREQGHLQRSLRKANVPSFKTFRRSYTWGILPPTKGLTKPKNVRTAPKNFLNSSRRLPDHYPGNQGLEADRTRKFTCTFGLIFVTQSFCARGVGVAGMALLQFSSSESLDPSCLREVLANRCLVMETPNTRNGNR